jgi:serine phosphatase RsbU (regulator of sigma subunit)
VSLRLRLVVAFFGLSVVPLAAVTTFTFLSNAQALRETAEREADLLAGELSQRMQLVTARLSERVEHVVDMAELEAALEDARAHQAASEAASVAGRPAAAAPPAPVQPVVPVPTGLMTDQLTRSLGEAAMLLNSLELQALPGAWRSRFGPRGDPRAPAGASGRAGRTDPGAPTDPRPPAGSPARSDRGVPARDARGVSPRGTPGTPGAPDAGLPPAGPRPPGSSPGGTPPSSRLDGPPMDKFLIDLAPIRRAVAKELLPEGRIEDLTPEQRTRLAKEVNERLIGVAESFRLGLASAASAAAAASAIDKAGTRSDAGRGPVAPAGSSGSPAGPPTPAGPPRAAASPPAPTPGAAPPGAPAPSAPSAPAAPSPPVKRSQLTGSRLDVKMQRGGQVVGQVQAEVNLSNVLATVFQTGRPEGGEVPFAVAGDGQIFARSDADRDRVRSLGPVASASGPATARLADWIVVTTPDPSGSGLKLGIARPVGDSLASLRRTTVRNAAFGLLFVGLALIGIVPLSSRLTSNLSALSDAVRQIAAGDFRARVPVTGQDEVGRLASAFNQMAEDVERHQRATVEQERLKRELELGRQIQTEMLPHAPLTIGLTEIMGVSVPAREVGGDFFNYFVLDSGEIALLVGDVSGKGVGAALLMANIQAALRTRLALGQTLTAVADAIDRDIQANSPGSVYATLFVGILNPATRELRYVNAGHHPQFVLRRSGELDSMGSTGLPVGLFASHGYRQETARLQAGDALFFYTDGCVEAERADGEMFGAARLEAVLADRPSLMTTDALLQRVESAIDEFRGQHEAFDDRTMMAVRVG